MSLAGRFNQTTSLSFLWRSHLSVALSLAFTMLFAGAFGKRADPLIVQFVGKEQTSDVYVDGRPGGALIEVMCVVDSGDYGAAGGLGPFLEEIRRSIFSSLGTNHTVQVCEFMKVLKPSQSIISSWISSPLPMTDYQAVVKIPINRLK